MTRSCFIGKWILAFFFCAMLLGCSKLTQTNFDKIKAGMSMKEVVTILGEPTKSESIEIAGISGTSAVWRNQQTEIVIQFLNDQVTIKSFRKTGEKLPDNNAGSSPDEG
ncbi:DUF3862 domain-containing protein [Aquicella lusitana]|mgnify:CR=1 FL=1|jgi:hypothetical protein|uniref:Uncharacterized protein DUF3862 n=1 Tax=Aquicella lusitana TaxID=254246 RepID=A0A370GLK0_9COXI|nr:DUF3862 domain-containing protein [Aquicella lusitana]RDI44551.1 uncharacterized protein DUF3862 [Aquicella lusitana]VVC72507.1 hypothetical protein AQULUS_02190 [Aquicella lusitana]